MFPLIPALEAAKVTSLATHPPTRRESRGCSCLVSAFAWSWACPSESDSPYLITTPMITMPIVEHYTLVYTHLVILVIQAI